MKLDDYLDSFQQVLDHPRHRAAEETLVELIRQLRACTDVDEGYEFQQALLAQVLAVEEDHHAFNRAVKRMANGKSPQVGAPEPQSGLDSSLLSTWQLELDICERVARQLRCVGDALAWRVFGFERQYITALARNQSPGMMAGKLGLAAERARVEQARREYGQFALMHGPDELPADRRHHRVHGRGTSADRGQDQRHPFPAGAGERTARPRLPAGPA